MQRRHGQAPGSLFLESHRILPRSDSARLAAEWQPSGDSGDELGRFFVERYVLYHTPGWLLRLFFPAVRESALWHGSITHEPWPLDSAVRLTAWDGGEHMLQATGLKSLVTGPCVAHASRGVGPITFYWRGAPPSEPREHSAWGS